MSVARERRINWLNDDTLTMSTRKRALFAAEKKFDEHGVEQLLEEDSDGADLGVACIDYDSTSSSDDAKDQSVPQTPNSWRMTTRSSKRREKNRSTPLSFESRRHRNNVLKEKLINTPSSSHSFTIDTESCSNSLQDLTFNSDSENNESKENTPVKVTSRNLRSSKRCSAKKSSDKASSKSSKISSPNSAYTEGSNLYRTNPALCGMKTPQESVHNDVPPPRHPHNRRSLQSLADKMSPSNSVSSKKRGCDDMLELSNPESKSLRNEHVFVPKARHSLFTSDAFKHFISPKSFYAKPNNQTEETSLNTSFSKSNSVSPSITKSTNSHPRHSRVYKPYKKKNGEINKGVKHGIRKPKHLKHSKIDVLKMAMDIIENSPLNDYINKIMKKDTTSTQNSNNESNLPKNPSLLSENQLKKMDAVLQQLGCESSIYKLFHNKTFNNINKTNTNSCDESVDEADMSEEIISSKENNPNNKFFKSSRNSSQKRTLTVKLSNNIKAQVQNGKICLPKKHLKNSSNVYYNKDLSKNNLGFDASDLMDDDDIYDLNDKQNINNLINQWDEEEIPLTEPQVNKDFIQVMQNIKDSEDLVSGSALKITSEDSINLNDKEMNIENTTIQLVPAENGAYLLVDDVDMSDDDTQYDIEKIEAELHDLDRKIKIMAEMNNINPEAFISPPKSKDIESSVLPTENEQIDSEVVITETENASTDKLFPIFVKGHQSTQIIQDENKSKNIKTTNKKIRSDHDQYIIDAGQKKLGASQCSECGLIYQIGDPEDEKYHSMHHLSLNILKFQGWKNETVSGQWADGARCILVHSNDATSHWNRVNQLLEEVVNPQLGFAASLTKEKPYKVYLYIENKMIIGCLVAEPRDSANKILTREGVDYCSTETYPVKCGVSRIWTHSEHRQKGVATRMMKSLCTSFMYGHILNNEEVAFSSPTPAGKLFIENFTKMKNFLIYLQ